MPQTILFLASSPSNQAKLRLDIEEREIREGLKRSSKRDEFELESRGAVRIQDMMRYLIELKPQIVHFSGHGAGDRGLILENDSREDSHLRGESRSIDIDIKEDREDTDAPALEAIFSLLSKTVECVVLNACYSETQARAIANHIPIVIGMRSAVEDKTAISFATAFYDALGVGENFERAFAWARAGVLAQQLKGADIPLLITQNSVSSYEGSPNADAQGASVSRSTVPASTIANTDKQYDIFISYRFTQHDWADALAHNLTVQGYKVFIDTWELFGGQNFARVIEDALKNSRCAILIATPEAADSGWVQHEYELMFNLEQKQARFFFIPVVWGTFPDFPFLETRQAVDFKQSTEEQYREGFQRLLTSLEQTAPGPKPYFEGLLKLPAAEAVQEIIHSNQHSFAKRIFGLLDSCDPVMVLAQNGFSTQHYMQALKTRAEQRYGKENVLHIFPPASLQASHDKYFAKLARQCGFKEEVQDSIDWGECMQQRLQGDDDLFLLVSSFENGAEDARRDLAGELRNLIEMHAFNFKLVLLGGERLAAMKYEDGDLSFLNTLAEEPLPSVCEEDVRVLYLGRYRDLDLSDAVLREILDFSGQHPRLVEACLRELSRGVSDYQQAVLASNVPAQLFSRFTAEDEGLCAYFEREQLGNYSVWPRGVGIRRLYWQNLLMGDERGKLVWRCELVRGLGKELLGCG